MTAICFSPENNTARLTSAMEKKSPIKLNKYQYNEKFHNVVIDKNSTITIHPKALPFAMKESMQKCLFTIESLSTTMPQQLVRIKATVKKISGVKTIKLERGNLTKSLLFLLILPSQLMQFFGKSGQTAFKSIKLMYLQISESREIISQKNCI